MSHGGQIVCGHGGSTPAFHSMTALLPEHRAGVFVAYNTDTGPVAVLEFLPAVLDLLFPAPLPKEPPPAPMADRAALSRFAGAYASSVVSETDFTKIAKLIEVVSIDVDADGYLVTRHPMFCPPARWRQVEPLVFHEVDGHRRLVFREDEKGAVRDVCWSPCSFMTWRNQSPSGSLEERVVAAARPNLPDPARDRRSGMESLAAPLEFARVALLMGGES